MNQQQIYQGWKPKVLGKILDIDGSNPGQCSQVDLSYGLSLFPNTPWAIIYPPTIYSKDFGARHNATYFEWIVNDHANLAQLPEEGDVMVFDATPNEGYANTYANPYGHTGVCEGATTDGYYLLQQNAPNSGSSVNVTFYPWKFRPCLGWLRPKLSTVVTTASTVPAKSQTVTLPASVPTWAVYKVGSGLVKGSTDQVGTLLPHKYGGLNYPIISWVGDYAVNVKTRDYGEVTLWVKNTDAVIK